VHGLGYPRIYPTLPLEALKTKNRLDEEAWGMLASRVLLRRASFIEFS
jgi:hypothetical protein